MNARELLQKYNPLLIIFPEDTTRNRPGSPIRGKGRGDYHPCSAELFLSLVIWRERPRPWVQFPFLPGVAELPLGLSGLKLKAEATEPAFTAAWEIDLAGIRSQNSSRAWSVYGEIRARPDLAPYLEPVVYARAVQGRDGPVLQYWYLYVYNDAPNKHEGDWEMVSIQLDADERPVTMAVAGHASGYKRKWADVEKQAADRPRIYVARGSHAAYFAYRKRGYQTNSLPSPKNLPPPIQGFVSKAYDLIRRFWPFWDHLAARPDDDTADPLDRGVALDIPAAGIVVLPELAANPAPSAIPWWMRLNGKWGSCHSRGFGVIAPDPPWRHAQWHRPSEWIEACLPDA